MIQEKLSELLRAVERQRDAEIDAGCCRTERDFKKAHEAQDRREELEAAFRAELENLVPDTVLTFRSSGGT